MRWPWAPGSLVLVPTEQFGRLPVVEPSARRQVAPVEQRLRVVQERVGELFDRDNVGCGSRLLARVERVLLGQILRERRRDRSRAEVVDLAADLLRPAPRGVREEREFGGWVCGACRLKRWE